MNNAVIRGADAFLARYEGLRERQTSARGIRDLAAESFRRMGLPTQRVEAWRYTGLRPLADIVWEEPLTAVDSEVPFALPAIDAARAVFVDGRFQPALSSLPDVACSFADKAEFGALAQPDRDPMAALNTMFAEDGLVIDVPAGVDAGTLVLVSHVADTHRPTAFHPRHRITLGAGAQLSLVERSDGHGSYLHNAVYEISVAAGAVLRHVTLQDEAPGAFAVATRYVGVAESGTYDAFVLNVGARLSRTEIHARLTGPHAAVHLNGAQLLGGNQHGDVTIVVSHDAPHCGSRQTVKNVLTDRSRGVFQGRIEVARPAQKTDGYQMSQALLLSPDAEIDCKPELQIYADDVKCSHGATVGELDDEQMFYLRSRGVPLAEARAILIRAFLAEALDQVVHEDARPMLDAAIERWWERRQEAVAA